MAARNMMGKAAFSALTAIPRAVGIILGLLFSSLRMLLVPSLMAGNRHQNRPDQLQVPVTPFVLKGDDGTKYDCILRGEIRGGFLKLGESVEVSGHIDRNCVVRVDQVQSLSTNAITKGWVDHRAKMAKVQIIIGVIFIIILIVFLV